jgi:Flp pilus assembly protein protease CpaA
MSLRAAVWLLAAVFIAGGVLAVIFILTRLLRSRATKTGIPYGLAIVAGACFVFATQMGIVGAERAKPFVVRPFIK